ncbi:MAG TPA: anti-sigma factor [Paraburkholderia sp.]|uniref:anti-sigma factor family protein n=1 Tax=Paraburkholderia sp. TaxID=1926495 RepID=UPI002B4756BC|nr:anti-sigma factor [Paraburkholderia sp.]HKR42298.1 anti-sigma factor [Paraburkholderia sp.]
MSDDPDPGIASGFGEPELRALSAFVDGELTAAEHQALGARLVANRRAASLVACYRAQRTALRVLCADLDAQTTTSYVLLRTRTSWWRRTALAVSSIAAGAALAGLAGVITTPVAPQSAQMEFAEQADLAYVVYAPERRHPVEVTAARKGALFDWLSQRLNRPLSAPSLQEYGYALLGGRLLPGIAGPAAQFMYENGAGARLTLYVSPASQREIPIQLLREGNRRTFSWTNDHMGYALSGQLTERQLGTIAVDVCSELGGHPEKWR